jgi:hypothetical protein
MASTREQRNSITKLSNSEGALIQDQYGMCDVAKNYFDNLFQQATNDDKEVTSFILGRVTG